MTSDLHDTPLQVDALDLEGQGIARREDGKVVNWAFETTTANTLYRRGWKKEDLGVGTTVTIEGWLARNGTP